MSQNLRDLQALFRSAGGMIESGMSRADVLRTLEAGMRACYPCRPDTDPRLSLACLACEDTGWERWVVYPRLYGGTVPVTMARPCACAKGRGKQAALDALNERPTTGPRRTRGLTALGQSPRRTP